jgi:L-fuconolactonase
MPACPIIDTHLHLWDPRRIWYPWLEKIPCLNRPYVLEDFRSATASLCVEAMVFMQCEAEWSAFEREAEWATEQARLEPRIRGMVAWAPLEKGGAAAPELERLRRYPLLRGVRRIIQFEPDLDFCLRPDFIEGVCLLKDYGLSFDICIDHRQLNSVVQLVERIPEVPMILDHMGKPAIRGGKMASWAEGLRALAQAPNVACKISGIATEADHRRWTHEQLRPYIDAAIEAFGFDRVMFGGDWPVSTQAIAYERWISLLDDLLSGVDESDQRKFWHDNAVAVYRLDGTSKSIDRGVAFGTETMW